MIARLNLTSRLTKWIILIDMMLCIRAAIAAWLVVMEYRVRMIRSLERRGGADRETSATAAPARFGGWLVSTKEQTHVLRDHAGAVDGVKRRPETPVGRARVGLSDRLSREEGPGARGTRSLSENAATSFD